MQGAYLWAAAVTALITWATHTFVGGVYVARPLLADRGLPKAAKWLAYYCWHLVTMMIAVIAAVFAAAAAGMLPLGWTAALSGFCLACSALSILVALKGGIAPWRFPSTSLFALTACFGFAGSAIG